MAAERLGRDGDPVGPTGPEAGAVACPVVGAAAGACGSGVRRWSTGRSAAGGVGAGAVGTVPVAPAASA
ncbi:hypothetical protein, partial [Streptomyces sp. AS13]|uniref:hypothetical protein n=1 Tax=Streptomyces sp. AS13 TaxID=3038080 RepID=UPI003557C153